MARLQRGLDRRRAGKSAPGFGYASALRGSPGAMLTGGTLMLPFGRLRYRLIQDYQDSSVT